MSSLKDSLRKQSTSFKYNSWTPSHEDLMVLPKTLQYLFYKFNIPSKSIDWSPITEDALFLMLSIVSHSVRTI